MEPDQHILVIKHGALGDIVLATAGFKAIREAYPAAHITALTTKPFTNTLAHSPYFNEIWVDRKPRFFDRRGMRALRRMLNSRRWDFVFDLQTSQRTSFYQWLFRHPWPRISNVSRWSSDGYTDHARHGRHALSNLQRQLALVGVQAGLPDLSWLVEDSAELLATIYGGPEPRPFALLVPGGAAHRPEKRWPAEQYAALAHELAQRMIVPVLIGTDAEKEALQEIAGRVPAAVNLGGKTSIRQLATLARSAHCAVGNDTGPMHIIAASHCPSTVIFSHASDPARSAPQGRAVTILRERDLSQLSVDRVLTSLPSPA